MKRLGRSLVIAVLAVELAAVGALMRRELASAPHELGRGAPVEAEPWPAQRHVLGDAHSGNLREMLVHHTDSRCHRVHRRVDDRRPASQLDGARVPLHEAEEDLHERALPRPVLAQEGMDLPGRAREIGPAQGLHGAEVLGDAAHAHRVAALAHALIALSDGR